MATSSSGLCLSGWEGLLDRMPSAKRQFPATPPGRCIFKQFRPLLGVYMYKGGLRDSWSSLLLGNKAERESNIDFGCSANIRQEMKSMGAATSGATE
jgi:hypothetical protein